MDIRSHAAMTARQSSDSLARKGVVAVALTRAETVQAIREYAARRGASLPSGVDQFKAGPHGASLRIIHDLDAWEADGYCDPDAA